MLAKMVNEIWLTERSKMVDLSINGDRNRATPKSKVFPARKPLANGASKI
jgi:hypothetical protein